MWELIGGFNPLLAISSGFSWVLNRGGLEGPRVTGDPGEIIPSRVGPEVSLGDQMLALDPGSSQQFPGLVSEAPHVPGVPGQRPPDIPTIPTQPAPQVQLPAGLGWLVDPWLAASAALRRTRRRAKRRRSTTSLEFHRSRQFPQLPGELGGYGAGVGGLPQPKVTPRPVIPRRRIPIPTRTPRRPRPSPRPGPRPVPLPLPDDIPAPRRALPPELEPYPIYPDIWRVPAPRRITLPRRAPQPLPRPPRPQPLPRPQMPAPSFPGPGGTPWPVSPVSPQPAPVKRTRRRVQPKPATQPWPFLDPLRRLLPWPSPDASPMHRPEIAPRLAPQPQFPEPARPLPEPLTSLNAQPLPFAQPQPDNECECEPDEKHRPKPSSVVAKVKPYSRRMSQWSLDNLR